MTTPSEDMSRLTVGTTADRIRLVSPAARAVLYIFATTGTAPDPPPSPRQLATPTWTGCWPNCTSAT